VIKSRRRKIWLASCQSLALIGYAVCRTCYFTSGEIFSHIEKNI